MGTENTRKMGKVRRWRVELELIDTFPDALTPQEILETLDFDVPDYIKVIIKGFERIND